MNLDGYLLCIIGTTLFSAILTGILPIGKTSELIKGVAKLICLLSILSPIPQFLQNQSFFDVFQDKNTAQDKENLSQSVITIDEPFIDYFCKMRITLLQEQIQTELQRIYAVECCIVLDCETDRKNGDLNLERIFVSVGADVSEEVKNQIRFHLETYYDSEVEFGE